MVIAIRRFSGLNNRIAKHSLLGRDYQIGHAYAKRLTSTAVRAVCGALFASFGRTIWRHCYANTSAVWDTPNELTKPSRD